MKFVDDDDDDDDDDDNDDDDDDCITRRSHSFTLHPHMNHTCLYSSVTRCHHPLAGT